MAYALSGNLIGTNNFSNMASSDATARHALGTIVNGVDNYYGGGSFIYMKAGAALFQAAR